MTRTGPGPSARASRASVEEIATEFAANPNAEAVAGKFGVTPEHVAQAVDYAVNRSFLTGDGE